MVDFELMNLDQFKACHDDWNSVVMQMKTRHIHLTHEWISAMMEYLNDYQSYIILRVQIDGRQSGYVALKKENIKLKKIFPFRRVRFLGAPFSDCGEIIATAVENEIYFELAKFLFSQYNVGEIELESIPEGSVGLTAFHNIKNWPGLSFHEKQSTECLFIDTKNQDWETFYQSLSKGYVKKDVRRLGNHYAKVNWTIQRFDESFTEVDLSSLSKLYRFSQARKNRQSLGNYMALLNILIKNLEKAKWLRIYVLKVDGEDISFLLGFFYIGIFYWWNTGFNPDYKQHSPTKFLLYNVLADLFKDPDCHEFNFMRGNSAYKTHWTDTFYFLNQIKFRNSAGLAGVLNRFRKI